MYSLEIKVEEYSYPALASDGLALVNLPILDSVACHSWNHDIAHFRPVDSDYQVYIRWSEHSPDGKLPSCWSLYDHHV